MGLSIWNPRRYSAISVRWCVAGDSTTDIFLIALPSGLVWQEDRQSLRQREVPVAVSATTRFSSIPAGLSASLAGAATEHPHPNFVGRYLSPIRRLPVSPFPTISLPPFALLFACLAGNIDPQADTPGLCSPGYRSTHSRLPQRPVPAERDEEE